jgi:ABC-type transporter Mla MlaB component
MATETSALCGGIDRSTVAAFREGLYRSIDAADGAIVEIDLSGVTFMDSSGYRAVVEANAYAVGSDHLLVIRNLSDHARSWSDSAIKATSYAWTPTPPAPTDPTMGRSRTAL